VKFKYGEWNVKIDRLWVNWNLDDKYNEIMKEDLYKLILEELRN
jgi:hypothetical protein